MARSQNRVGVRSKHSEAILETAETNAHHSPRDDEKEGSGSVEPNPVLRPRKAAPVAALFEEAVTHHNAGRIKEAEKLYRRICKQQPAHAPSWSLLGLLLVSRGAAAEATIVCRRAVSIRPDYLDAHLNLIAALEATGALDEAADAYRQAIPLAPARADLWNNFGAILDRQGRTTQAVLAFREATKVKPDFADAYFNMARALCNLGFTDEAINTYRLVVALNAGHVAAWSNLGTLLGATGHFAEAIAASQRAAALAPSNAEILCNLGVVLQRQGNVGAAVAAYEKAIAIKPNYAAALGNLAAGLQEQYKFDEAAAALKQAIAAKPDFDTAIVELIKIRRHICDWSAYEADHKTLIDFIAQQKDTIFMLLLMCFPSTPVQQLECARVAMKRHNESAARIGPHAEAAASAKIRVGYLSTDYRDHPVGRLLPEMFARHNRDQFEVIGYSMGVEDRGLLRQRIRQGCDAFVDLHHMSNLDAAKRIHADKVDILVDLTGPTVGSRLEILALRPAPIQVSFLGWPGTMGADCIDYIIADSFIVPRDQQAYYVEKIIHLPDCYQPSDPQRPVPAVIPSRAECGLPEEGFIFCSFNNPNKITPEMFDLWMRILKRVDNSTLWLYCKSKQTTENLSRWAEARGVAANRIVFASVALYEAYLGRLCVADLFLDSAPYNAGATCNDALWVGLPVLTCAGETYVSRMAGSLLTAAGAPELITTSLDAYEELAVRLASEPGMLNDLRQRLEANRTTHPLFDMGRFIANLERAYHEIQDIRRANEKPRFISI
jgi:predicted O-linked N-acetylglucosamine transferase (SPINDLY family)